MRVVFMGTPELAATVLEAIAARHEVVGVFTRPDAVRGRGKALVASPVKRAARSLGIAVHEPRSLKGRDALELMEGMRPDVACVAAYGAILPAAMLEVPAKGCLNVHTSLLPRWRGAAPIERAIIARDQTTGVCVMRMEEGLDTGAYCVKRTTRVGEKYLGELSRELADLGSEALLEALDRLEEGSAEWTDQGEEGITYASKIEKGELDFDSSERAQDVCAKVRASNSSHPSRITLAGKRLAVERAHVADDRRTADLIGPLKAGEATFKAKRLFIGVSDGIVEVEQVKPEGKKSMEGRAFAAGIQGFKDTRVTWGRA